MLLRCSVLLKLLDEVMVGVVMVVVVLWWCCCY